MECTLNSNMMRNMFHIGVNKVKEDQSIATCETNVEYIIKEIRADDEALKEFLFTLGCYEGEAITVISVLAENFVVSVKDARYSIDTELAAAIII